MKKTIIGLTAILFLLLNTLQAQTKVWFREDFDDNGHNWNLVKTKSAGLEIKDGQLYVSTGPNYVYNNEVNVYMDYSKEFTAEVKFQVNSQAANNHSGIYITDKSGRKNYFTINTSNQTYWVGTIENGNQVNLGKTDPGQNAGWQKSTIIKPAGEYNTLTIARKKDKVYFSINEQQVFSVANKAFCADIRKYIGFTNFSEARVMVDYIQFDQNNWKNVIGLNEKPVPAVSLGNAINSAADEINPVLTADGKTLYFTRLHYKNNYEGIILGENARGDGDIYYSEFVDGEWTFAKHLAFGISNKDHNMLASVSPDGNSLLLFGAYNEKEKTTDPQGGVSVTTRTATGWTYPQPLKIKNFYTNSGKVNFSMSADWETLILSIDRKDSRGGADLYVSFKQKDGSWSEPKHTGPKINTPNTDFAPFLAADNKTLYFASWDLPGYGEADMFMTKRLDDSWANWSDPVNLGPAINNEGFNAYCRIPSNTEKVYFASHLNAIGDFYCDIFVAKLPEDLKPEPSVLVQGKVLDAVTKLPVKAKVIFKRVDEDTYAAESLTDSLGGGYTVALPSGKKYTYYALKEGYLPLDEELNLSAVKAHQELSKDILLTPILVGQTAKLNNVFFKQGQAQLLPNSYPELDRLVEIMKTNPTMKIELQGHTDNQGDQKLNQVLSEQRVTLVKKYLVGKGIKNDRIAGKGFGGLKPLVNNDTEDNRKQNRRVEFVITNQ